MEPNCYELVPQDQHLLIDEITRRAGQNLTLPGVVVAPFGVTAGTQDDEIAPIKTWLEARRGWRRRAGWLWGKALAQMGVKSRAEQGELERIKVWMKFLKEMEAQESQGKSNKQHRRTMRGDYITTAH